MSGNEMGRGGAALRSTSEAGRAITGPGGCCQMGCQIRADHKSRGRDIRTQPLPPADSSRADTDRQLGWAVFVIGTEARNLFNGRAFRSVCCHRLSALLVVMGGWQVTQSGPRVAGTSLRCCEGRFDSRAATWVASLSILLKRLT